jgi:hypothetical protein
MGFLFTYQVRQQLLKVRINYLNGFKPFEDKPYPTTLKRSKTQSIETTPVMKKNANTILRETAKILATDVSLFRKIILDSGGGQLPAPIQEKQKLLKDIEKVLGESFGKSNLNSPSSMM